MDQIQTTALPKLVPIKDIEIGESTLLNLQPTADNYDDSREVKKDKYDLSFYEMNKIQFKLYKPMIKKYLTLKHNNHILKRDLKVCEKMMKHMTEAKLKQIQ